MYLYRQWSVDVVKEELIYQMEITLTLISLYCRNNMLTVTAIGQPYRPNNQQLIRIKHYYASVNLRPDSSWVNSLGVNWFCKGQDLDCGLGQFLKLSNKEPVLM